MATFESIFSKKDNADPNLNKLFSRKSKIVRKPDTESIEVNNETDTNKIKEESSDSLKKKLKKFDPEVEKRTIFVGNLHNECKKEELLKIFKSFGKIESVRFRNIVPEDITKSKKYAFITKQKHPNKKNINAFVKFKEIDSAINAAKEINGMEYKSFHLRVDIATKSKCHDNKKSLFLGGLPFDITEEDLYSHFKSCGTIDSVRIIRDNKTGIGKGFGYITFQTSDTVSLGLKLDGSKINERKIRVSRCVKKQKAKKEEKGTKSTKSDTIKTPSKNKFQNHSDNNKKKDFKTKNFSAKSKSENKKSNSNLKKKQFKKPHIGTNNKNANRFKI